MKKNFYFLDKIVAFGILLYFLLPVQTQATILEFNDLPLEINVQNSYKKPLTNKPIELIGPRQEINLYYEVKNALKEGTHQIVFELQNSKLLIDPSSFTVKIDSTAVETRSLTGEEPSQTVTIPLNSSQLTKGIHEITLTFHGIIKEGICVDQYNAGNWLLIGIDSYIEIFEEQTVDQLSFSNYPEGYIGTAQAPLQIVLPKNASTSTLQSGLILAAYMNDQTDFSKSVQIVREHNVNSIIGNIILIGAYDEFDSNWVTQLFERSKVPSLKEEMYIAQHTLTDNKNHVRALFILGNKPEDITDRLEVLINQEVYRQFAGNELRIKSIPKTENNADRIVPLKKFGMTNLLLNGNQSESQPFFYFAPSSVKNEPAILELSLKKSETIRQVSEITSSTQEVDVELTVLINGVPHSVDIRQLNEELNGNYIVQIPIDPKVFQENQLVSVQFKSSGLRKSNPCINTDDQHWVYISEDSFMNFPLHENMSNYSLAALPYPFVNKPNETIIVLAENHNISDDELLKLFTEMTVAGKPPYFKLETSSKIQEEELKNHHLIFIGGVREHSLLQSHMSNLIISHKEQLPMLQDHGFLIETVDQIAWIQPSPWNEKNYSMFIIEELGAATEKIDSSFLTLLGQLTEPASIAVYGKNKQIFTNAQQWQDKEKAGGETNISNESQLPKEKKWVIILFGALIVFLISILWVIIRKKRKQKIE